jgi:ribose transport system substrate-binding protein
MRRLGVTQVRAAFGVLAAVSLIAAAGCGSSGDKGSGGAAAATGASTTASGSGFDMAAVKARVSGYEKGPTEYAGPTDPVKTAKGIELATIPCSGAIRGCVRPVEEAGRLAKQLGWRVRSYDGKGTPKDNNNAVQQAVAGGADVILTGGVDPSFISAGLQAARAKGVIVGSMSQGVGPSPTGYAFDIGADYTLLGQQIGDFVVADSDGKADYLPFNDKSYASTVAFVNASIESVKACPSCTVEKTQFFVGTDIAKGLGPRLIDLLRQNQKIDYVMGSYDPAATAMVPAIANAGLKSRVKVVGGLGNQQNLEYVKANNIQVADAGFDNTYMAYMAIYQVNRLLAKQPLWKTPGETRPAYMYSGKVPIKLFTTSSPPAQTSDYVATDTLDYPAKMRPLLGLSGSGN